MATGYGTLLENPPLPISAPARFEYKPTSHSLQEKGNGPRVLATRACEDILPSSRALCHSSNADAISFGSASLGTRMRFLEKNSLVLLSAPNKINHKCGAVMYQGNVASWTYSAYWGPLP